MQAGSGTKEAWIGQLRAQAALARALALFAGAGVRALPVKGVVTGPLLYDDLALRPLLDVDLRISSRDFARARRAIAAAALPILQIDPAYQVVVFEIDGMQIDVETQVGPRGLCALTVDEMLDHASSVQDGHLTPEIHEHAVLLVLNVWKDKLRFAAAHAVEDLLRIVRQPSFRGPRFVEVVARAGISTVAWLVADYLATERSDLRWTKLREALGPLSRKAYAAAFRALLHADDSPPWLLALLARAGADPFSRRAGALGFMAWHVALRWRRRIHS